MRASTKSALRPRPAAGQRTSLPHGDADAAPWWQRTLKVRLLFAGAVLALTLVVVIWDAAYLRGVDSLDVVVYRCYAHGFWDGAQAAHDPALRDCSTIWDGTPRRFHSFPREYPAPALAVFSLPLLLPWLSYGAAFVLWMAVVLLAATGLVAWRGPPEAALALPLYVLLAGWSFTLQRYDLLPGLCILLALMLTRHGRPRTAAATLAVATVLKFFPVVLLPVLLIAAARGDRGRGDRGRRWLDLLVVFVGVCALCTLPALALDPSSLLGPLRFELERPLHIESLLGIVLWLCSGAVMGPVGGAVAVFSYNSLNVVWGPQNILTALAAALGLLALVVAYVRAWRGLDSPARTTIVILVALIATGKVFSPQYLLWVLPVAALAEGLRLRWLLLAALTCVIIQSYYAVPLADLPGTPLFAGAIAVRDLLLCALAALYLLTPGDLAGRAWPNTAAWRLLGA